MKPSSLIVLLKEEGSVFTFLLEKDTFKVDNIYIMLDWPKRTLPNTLPKLSETPQASVERLMTLLIPEPKKHFLTVVCCPNLTLRHRDYRHILESPDMKSMTLDLLGELK